MYFVNPLNNIFDNIIQCFRKNTVFFPFFCLNLGFLPLFTAICALTGLFNPFSGFEKNEIDKYCLCVYNIIKIRLKNRSAR